jgi:hypothetical protein
MSELMELGGLWEGTDKKGQTYFSGTINQHIAIKVFKNHRKSNSSQPDYYIFLAKNEKRAPAKEPSQTSHLNEVKAPEQRVNSQTLTSEPTQAELDRVAMYQFKFGKYKGQNMIQIPTHDVESYVNYLARVQKENPERDAKKKAMNDKSNADLQRLVYCYVWAEQNGKLPQGIHEEPPNQIPWPDEPPPMSEELPF